MSRREGARGHWGALFSTTLIVAALAAVVGAAPAQAHTILERSEPAENAVLVKAPKVVLLSFSEAVEPSLTRARIADAEGRVITGVRVRTTSSLLTLRPPRLRRGTYVVTWTVLAADDGHIGRGNLVFAVGERVDPRAAAAASSTSDFMAGGALLRWLNFVLLASLVGGLAVARFVLPAGDTRTAAARKRVLGWAGLCGLQALVVGVGLLLSQSLAIRDSAGAVWSMVTGTRWGVLWSLREGLILALVVAVLFLRRARGRAFERVFAASAALSVGLMTVQAFMGHAAGLPSGTTLSILADTAHLLAAGLWVGGLIALVVTLWPLRTLDSFARASLARFAAIATVSIAVLAVTGLYAMGRQVASVDALLTTLYGGALLTKIALMLAAGALGLASTLLLHPTFASRFARMLGRPASWKPLGRRRLPALILGEACAGVLILLAVGILTATTPARGPQFAQAPTGVPSTMTRSVEDLLVAIAVRPNRPGENVVDVRAVTTRRPAPAAVERVLVRFATTDGDLPPATVVAMESEPGLYRVSGGQLSEPGSWRIDAVVERTGLPDETAGFDWTVGPSVAPRPVVISNEPLQPLLSGAAALLLLVSLGAGLVWLTRRRPLRPDAGGAPRAVIESLERDRL